MFSFKIVSFFFVIIALITKSKCQAPEVTKAQEQSISGLPDEIAAIQLLFTFPPGCQGNPPHFHNGPALGYVLEGEYLFQTDDEDPRLVQPGETVYVKDMATHIWSANPSTEKITKVLFTIYGRPTEPVVTFKEGFERLGFEEAMKVAQKSK